MATPPEDIIADLRMALRKLQDDHYELGKKNSDLQREIFRMEITIEEKSIKIHDLQQDLKYQGRDLIIAKVKINGLEQIIARLRSGEEENLEQIVHTINHSAN